MTDFLKTFSNFYRTPTEAILQHRQTFYLIQKESTEPIAEWFCRIRSAIEHCDFGDIGDFLVIDKFFCGLDSDVGGWLHKNTTWSADQLFQAIIDPEFPDSNNMIVEHRLGIDELLRIELEDAVSNRSSIKTICYKLYTIKDNFLFNLCHILNDIKFHTILCREAVHHFSTPMPITVM